MVDKELLDILACPACKSEVELREGKIICLKCGRRYPIRDDIPVMLIDEAEMPDKI
ncbi:Trm112 family protein [candidate division NPL-UPA2 bacterium]|nr:Trm112 family protein [candidate division NPL-UPA2 bacterium]